MNIGTFEKNNESLNGDYAQLDAALSRLDQLPEDDKAVKKAWPKFLRELLDVMTNELERTGKAHDDARKLASRLVARQAHHLGGRMVYIPRDDRLKTAMRDMEIYENYNGGNSRALSERYGLTQQRICNIVREQHQINQRRVREKLAC